MDISKIMEWIRRAVDWLSICWRASRPFLKKALQLLEEFLLTIAAIILAACLWLWENAGRLYKKAAVHIRNMQRLPQKRQTFSENTTKWIRYTAIALLAFFMCFCLFQLSVYISDYISSKRISKELRDAYYVALDEETHFPATATPSPTLTPESTPAIKPAPSVTAVPSATPTATPRTALQPLKYPGNPYAMVSSRFKTLQRQNSDIIGWLTIPDVIDEAVVQRDNTYYLRRDYRGYHNNNGAIFLEESCKLNTRPYTLMLFGHNMKSGAMFGNLRNYESVYYYRNNAFITFDTAYEDGRYVIFATGTMSQDPTDNHFVDTVKLCSLKILWREEAIRQLKRVSEVSTSIDIAAEDQLLLLFTCVGDNTERRFVAARRIREDETEDALLRLVRKAQ